MAGAGVGVLVFLNVFLLLGLCLRHFAKRLSALVPYTVLLLLIGAGLGFAGFALEEEDAVSPAATGNISDVSGSAGGSTDSSAHGSSSGPKEWYTQPRDDFVAAIKNIAGMDPHLLLFIFLPALLFESANAIDYHCFQKVRGKTLALAFPGMMLGTLMMASIVRIAYPTWSWDLALLLGTITSATDPVAVVAMLRELGAKVSLSTTIEGESLLNDGSAVVLFVVLKGIAMAGGVVESAGGIVEDFFRMAVLGPLLGYIFGVVALQWISRVFNDPLVEISISIVAAYLAFYVSEFWIKSSGVLTVVFVGLAFSSTAGRTSISPEVFHFMHEFWEILGYIANTIIFLITGIAIAYNANNIQFEGRDIGFAFVIYFSAIVIRMILFVFTYPLFSRLPYGWSWQEALIAAWGGLRGAVGLALGLDIMFSTAPDSLVCPEDGSPPNLACSSVKGRILLHTSAMVVLTLCINASTLKPLLGFLKFVELSREELTMLAHVAERLKRDSRKEMKRIQDDPFLSNSNWEIVRQYADLNELFKPLLKGTTVKAGKRKGHDEHTDDADDGQHGAPNGRASIAEKAISRFTNIDVPEVLLRESIAGLRYSLNHAAEFDSRSTSGAEEEMNLLSELKYHYHMSLKAGIWHLQHQGTLGQLATDILVDTLNHKLDDKHSVDWIRWEDLQKAGGETKGLKVPDWMNRMRTMPLVGWAVNLYLSSKLQMRHDLAFGFLTVHEHMEHDVHHWTHDSTLISKLHEVLHENAEGARMSLIDLQEVLPEVSLEVNTRQAARLMLNKARENVNALEAAGSLPEPQAKAMVAQVETQMRKLQLAKLVFDLSKEKVLSEVPWMQELTAESFNILVDAAQERHFLKGDYLVRQGDVPTGEGDAVFLVARGIVEIVEEYENLESSVVARRGSGYVIGEQSLMTGSPRAASARAVTSVVALGLSMSAMKSAMDSYPELANRMWHHVGLNLAQKLLGDSEEAHNGERSTPEELHALSEEWVPNMNAVLAKDPGERVSIDRKVLLLHGACIEYREDEPQPSGGQFTELANSVKREAEETQRTEQQAMRHQVRRDRNKVRRISLHATIFGSTPAPDAAKGSSSATEGSISCRQGEQHLKTAASPESSPMDAAKRAALATRAAQNMSLARGGTGNNFGLKAIELGKERRSLHQSSPWVVHLAPCIIDVPTGGVLAKHELQCITSCRLAIEPSKKGSDSGSFGETTASRHHVELEGAPLPLVSSPHELRPTLVNSLLKKLSWVRYQPGELIYDVGSIASPSVVFFLSGAVECSLDPTPAPIFEGDVPSTERAGEPFTEKTPVVFSPPSGSPLGEWLLLQPNLAELPKVVAHSTCHCVQLTEDTLTGAMQQDEQLMTNLWWARCQRETFCFLRRLEPFCWWQASKLWKWVSFGRHVKVPEGKGHIGASVPFVVLVQGKCSISYQEQHSDDKGARYSVDGQRRALGSMKLLGSGAKIADLLTFNTNSKRKDSPLTTPHGTVKSPEVTVPGPDVVHCIEGINYHFARDSLVFIPSERGLPWLPTNYIFTTPQYPATPDSPHSPFGIRVANGEKAMGIQPGTDSATFDA